MKKYILYITLLSTVYVNVQCCDGKRSTALGQTPLLVTIKPITAYKLLKCSCLESDKLAGAMCTCVEYDKKYKVALVRYGTNGLAYVVETLDDTAYTSENILRTLNSEASRLAKSVDNRDRRLYGDHAQSAKEKKLLSGTIGTEKKLLAGAIGLAVGFAAMFLGKKS